MNLKEKLASLNLEEQKHTINFDELVGEMLANIGSTDPELRDSLIYSTFYRLIKSDCLTETQMENLLDACLGEDYLFYKIGEKESDSVFTRSFSSLVLALLLSKDREKLFLPKHKVLHTIDETIRYLMNEKDTRGHVDGKGWAHSTAHGADLLDHAVKHPYFDMDLAGKSLRAISECILYKEALYIDDEEERLLYAIISLLKKGLSEDVLQNWVQEIMDYLDEKTKEGYSLPYFYLKKNITNLLKSLYFRLKHADKGLGTRITIESFIYQWIR